MPPAELWEALSRTDDYRNWWTWLRRFEGDGLVEGGRTHCEVRAPLPYSLRFAVTVRRLVPAELLEAEVTGDIEGPAQLEISGGAVNGSNVRLTWAVEVKDRLLRAGAMFGRPLMQWGHEWVVATGMTQFKRNALDGRGELPQP